MSASDCRSTCRSASTIILSTVLAGMALTCPVKAEPILALVTSPNVVNALVRFDSATPGNTSIPIPIIGVQAMETVVGIDIRPTTGELFGVGSGGNLYTINPATGVATLRAMLTAGLGSSFSNLTGTYFGVDFNPVPDLAGNPSFRVVSDADQNLRIDANNGQVFQDTNINPVFANIIASAYANNDVDPNTGTTLYGIDSVADTLVTQFPANAGTITTVGSLGLNVSSLIGFDISRSGRAFAAITAPGFEIGGPSNFYSINVTTGAATLIGNIGPMQSGFSVRGLTAQPLVVPEPSTTLLSVAGLALVYLGRKRFRRP